MAICSNCGAETTRLRSRWIKGTQLTDQCPQCAPEEFEGKVTMPSDKKIHMGFEAHPNEYEKRYDQDGVYYVRKPEYRAEQEAHLQEIPEDEKAAQSKAAEQKRLTRRTKPMSTQEVELFLKQFQEQADEAERLSWTLPPTGSA